MRKMRDMTTHTLVPLLPQTVALVANADAQPRIRYAFNRSEVVIIDGALFWVV